MKSVQELVQWVEAHGKLVCDLAKAEELVGGFGKIVIIYQNGKYIGMDACPRERVGG